MRLEIDIAEYRPTHHHPRPCSYANRGLCSTNLVEGRVLQQRVRLDLGARGADQVSKITLSPARRVIGYHLVELQTAGRR